MFSTNDWFYFTGALDKKTCNKIRNSAKGKWKESTVNTKKDVTAEERITGGKSILATDKNIRISDIAWTTDQWIYDRMWPYMLEANARAGW